MSVIKGCSFAVRVSTGSVIPIPTKKEKEERLVDAEKKKQQQKNPSSSGVCASNTQPTFSGALCTLPLNKVKCIHFNILSHFWLPELYTVGLKEKLGTAVKICYIKQYLYVTEKEDRVTEF